MTSTAPRDLTPAPSSEPVAHDLGAADDHLMGRRAALHRGVAGLAVAAVAAVATPSAARAARAGDSGGEAGTVGTAGAAAGRPARPRTPECLADLTEG